MVDLGKSQVFKRKALEPFARSLWSHFAFANGFHQLP